MSTICHGEDDCVVDIANLIVNIIFIVLTPLLGSLAFEDVTRAKPVRLREHNARWIVFILLAIVNLAEICDAYLISSEKHLETFSYPAPAIAALVATLMVMFSYNLVEKYNEPKPLLILLFYWSLILFTKILKLGHLYYLRLDVHHISVTITLTYLILYVLSLLLEVNLLWTHKYLSDGNEIPISENSSSPSFPSVVTFNWMNDFMLGETRRKKGISRRKLEKKVKGFEIQEYLDKFKKIYSTQASTNDSLSLWKTLLKSLWCPLTFAAFFKFISDLLSVVPPLTVGVMVNFVSPNHTSALFRRPATVNDFFRNGFVTTCVLFSTSLFYLLFHNHFIRVINIESVRLRSILQMVIYDKLLKISLPVHQKHDTNAREINDSLSRDVNLVVVFVRVVHFVWSFWFKILLFSIFLYLKIGWSSLVGISLSLLLLFPAQFYLKKLMTNTKIDVMTNRLRRVNRINEMMIGIRALKMNVWEGSFAHAVHRLYQRESRNLCVSSVYWWFHDVFTWLAFILMSTLGFSIHSSVDGESLSPAATFTALALFFQIFLYLFVSPVLISATTDALTSVKRLQTFLESPELRGAKIVHGDEDGSTVLEIQPDSGSVVLDIREPSTQPDSLNDVNVFTSDEEDDVNLSDEFAVKIYNASFSRDAEEDSKAVLSEIYARIPSGKITFVSSLSGDGDLAFVLALLGELHLVSGSINWRTRNPSVALAPRKLWFQQGSVRDNILFGLPYDANRYNLVVDACQLRQEFPKWPLADLTSIDDPVLSDDYKHRISIARAFYSKCKVVIIEFALDFVEWSAAVNLCHGGLRKFASNYNRTIIIVSRKATSIMVDEADLVILFQDDHVKYSAGNWIETTAVVPSLSTSSFATLPIVTIEDERTQLTMSPEQSYSWLHFSTPGILHWMGLHSALPKLQPVTEYKEPLWSDEHEGTLNDLDKDGSESGSSAADITRAMLPTTETVAKLPLKLRRLMTNFLSHCGTVLSLVLIPLLFVTVALFIGRDAWLLAWVNTRQESLDDSAGLPLYLVLSLLSAITLCVLGVVASIAASRAWSSFHTAIIDSVAKSSLGVLTADTTDKVMTFLKSEFSRLQDSFPVFIYQAWFVLLCVSIFIISFVVSPFFVFALILLILITRFISNIFTESSSQIHSIEVTARSNVDDHLTDTLSGLVLMRSFQQHKNVLEQLRQLLETYNLASLAVDYTHRWYSLRSELPVLIYVWAVCLVAVNGGLDKYFTPAFVGFAAVYMLLLPVIFKWTIFMWPRFISDAVLIEKAESLSQFPTEIDENIPIENAMANWPSSGVIRFERLSIPPFNSISFKVASGQKVGLSFTENDASRIPLLFLRMTRVPRSTLYIDDVDVSKVSRSLLRQRICVVTNDVDVFEGTIRINLDMKNSFSDDDLWSALDTIGLKDKVASLPDGLNSPISNESTLLNIREIELLCLTRNFLRRPKIIVTYKISEWMTQLLIRIFPSISMLCLSNDSTTLSNCDEIIYTENGEIVSDKLSSRDD